MNLTVEIPDEIFYDINESKQSLTNKLREKLAIELYKNSKITLTQGAKLLACDVYDFISLLNKNSIPVIDDYNIEDEIKNIKSLM
jgi:predicted HTH domain antitoxin